jgi:hypothetical protein
MYEYCPICHWQDDPIQRDEPARRGGANSISLNEAKAAFAAGEDLRLVKEASRLRFRTERAQAFPAEESYSPVAAFV